MLFAGWESLRDNGTFMRRAKNTCLSSTESCSKEEEDSDETETTSPDSLSGSHHRRRKPNSSPQAYNRSNMSAFRNSVHGYPVPTMAYSGGKELNPFTAHPWVFSHPNPLPYVYPVPLQSPFGPGAMTYNAVPDLPLKTKPKKFVHKNRKSEVKSRHEPSIAEGDPLSFLNLKTESGKTTRAGSEERNHLKRRFSDSELYKLSELYKHSGSVDDNQNPSVSQDASRSSMPKQPPPPLFHHSEEDGDDASEESVESMGQHHLSRLVSTLIDELRTVRQQNRQLWLELHQARLELETARADPKTLTGATYQPGYISSLVQQIYSAQRLREEAMSNGQTFKPWHNGSSQNLLNETVTNGHKMHSSSSVDQLNLQRDALMFRLHQTEKQLKQLELDEKEREFLSWHEDYAETGRRLSSHNVRSCANSVRPSSSPGLRPVVKDLAPSVNSLDGRRCVAVAAEGISNRAQSLPLDLTVLSGSQEEDNLVPNAVQSALNWTPRLTRLSEPRLEFAKNQAFQHGHNNTAAAEEVVNSHQIVNGVDPLQRHRASSDEPWRELEAASRLDSAVQWTADANAMTRTELEAQIALLEKERSQLDQDLQATLAGRRESEERVVRLERLVGVLKKKLTRQRPGSLSEASLEHSIESASSCSSVLSPKSANLPLSNDDDHAKAQEERTKSVPCFFDQLPGSLGRNGLPKKVMTSPMQEPLSPLPSPSGPQSLPSYVRILGPVTEL